METFLVLTVRARLRSLLERRSGRALHRSFGEDKTGNVISGISTSATPNYRLHLPVATDITPVLSPGLLPTRGERGAKTCCADNWDMDLSAIALQGLDQAQTALETAAAKIASVGTLSPDTPSVDSVDLSAEMVALLSAKNAFSVNIATLKVADEVQESLIDLIA